MADDTLSPVGFDRPFIKLNVPAERRFALACLAGRWGGTTSEGDVVRHLLCEALDAAGMDEQWCIREYAAYRVACLRDGVPNQFER